MDLYVWYWLNQTDAIYPNGASRLKINNTAQVSH